jgi:ABC-type glycerol-3-phosphate transport system substrate-binding protein
MRRAMPVIALVAAGLMLAGCSEASSPAAGSAPSTNGIGPITFAIGKDDIGWLTGVIAGWNKNHPNQKVTPLLLPEASNDQLAQLVANLQAKSDEYDVIDMDVIWTAEFASNGWIIPLPESQFPDLGDFLKPAVDTAMYQVGFMPSLTTATPISSTTARTSSPRRESSLPRPGLSWPSSPRPWRRSTGCTDTPERSPRMRA